MPKFFTFVGALVCGIAAICFATMIFVGAIWLTEAYQHPLAQKAISAILEIKIEKEFGPPIDTVFGPDSLFLFHLDTDSMIEGRAICWAGYIHWNENGLDGSFMTNRCGAPILEE